MSSINHLGAIPPPRAIPWMAGQEGPPTDSQLAPAPDPRKVAAAQAEAAAAQDERRAQRLASAMKPIQRRRVAVEWHAASLSYVHRILDPGTGEQIQQFPAAQVLDMVDDLMRQIQKG